jgi:hypothetical protein
MRRLSHPLPGFVYVIVLGNESVKIGRAENLEQHLRHYQYGLPQAKYSWSSKSRLTAANYWEHAMKDEFDANREVLPSDAILKDVVRYAKKWEKEFQ